MHRPAQILQYLKEGNFIDGQTKQLKVQASHRPPNPAIRPEGRLLPHQPRARSLPRTPCSPPIGPAELPSPPLPPPTPPRPQLVIYNAAFTMFSFVEAEFDVSLAGGIEATSKVDTIAMDPYADGVDFFRAALEVLFVIMLVLSLKSEYRDLQVARKSGRLLEFLTSIPTLLDIVSFGLNLVEIIFWPILVFGMYRQFRLEPAWDVYTPSEGRLLQYDEAKLADLMRAFDNVAYISRISALYVMLHGALTRVWRSTRHVVVVSAADR